MDSKPIWQSKTIWFNFLALVAMFLQQKYGFVLDVQAQTAILIVVNVILRAVTKQPVSWE